jgi:hypothetical protein
LAIFPTWSDVAQRNEIVTSRAKAMIAASEVSRSAVPVES